MKKYIITIIALFFFNFSFGQSIVLKGKIIDRETSNPLPFATVEIHKLHTGTIASENGTFELTVLSQSTSLDTIEFSHLGYNKTKILIEDFLKLENKTISIKANYTTLDEVVIIPQEYSITELGIINKTPQSKHITNLFNNKIGNYIGNKKNKIGWIKSVSFYIDKEGHPETPFRIRIYDLNKEKKCPGNDILNENLIVSANKSGWFTVDLTSFNIPFPIEGAFVMMEWINSGDKYFYERELIRKNEKGVTAKVKSRFYGQAIGSVLKQPEMITWGITLGNEWIPYKLYYKGYINAMIKAKIAYPLNK